MLGDPNTLCEAVPAEERWSNQLAVGLHMAGSAVIDPPTVGHTVALYL
ncbi:MAG: hypothetical protein ACWGO1_07465 [Anaerolineales bacterium]